MNIALAASRRDWTKAEQWSANRLAAKDCAAAAWNVRETFKGRLANERECALEACGLRDVPTLGEVLAHVEARLGAWALGAPPPADLIVAARSEE